MATYQGYDLLDQTQPGRTGEEKEIRRSVVLLDNKTGKRTSDDRGGTPVIERGFSWLAQGRSAVNTLKAFITARKGRAVPVWVPTYQRDLALTTDVGSADIAITVKDINYTNMMFPNAARRHIAFIGPSGAITPRKITSAMRNANNTETLTLDSAVGASFSASTMVCFLALCRLAEDEVEITWHSVEVAEATLRFVEVPREVA
jgi:hypothetical protein